MRTVHGIWASRRVATLVDRSRTVSLTSSSSLPALFLPLMLEEELASSLPAMLTEMLCEERAGGGCD